MRVVVVSDIHANLASFEKVLADFPSYDELYCLGDVVGYGPDPNQVVESLRTCNPTVVLAGNHDHAVVTGQVAGFVGHAVKAIQWTRNELTKDNLAYLSDLNPSAHRKISGLTVAMFHGSPRDPLNEYVFPGTPSAVLKELLLLAGCNLLLQGHTHVPMAYKSGSSMLLNPGSVGQPRDGDPRASYLIIDVDGEKVTHKVKRVAYDIQKTSKRILEKGLPSFLAERLQVGI